VRATGVGEGSECESYWSGREEVVGGESRGRSGRGKDENSERARRL
jgi:hypothetical protein